MSEVISASLGHRTLSHIQWPSDGRLIWDTIYRSMPSASAFLSTVWTGTWVSTFGASLHPTQLLLLDDVGHTIGTCLITNRSVSVGPMSLRRAFLNTDGEDAKDSVIVEHNSLLALPGHETQVARNFAVYMASTRIDEFVASGLSEVDVDRLQVAFHSWAPMVEWRDSPYVDLARLRSENRNHLQALSANTRAQLRRALRAYTERGKLQIDQALSSAEAATMLAELVTLHELRWQAKGKEGAFGTELRQRFHVDYVHAGAQADEAQLLRVRSGPQTIGIVYCLVANGRVSFYQSGFAFESNPTFKPGLVTHHLVIEHYLKQGYLEYDFLVSGQGEGRYKRSLSTDSRRLGWVSFSRPGFRNAIFNLARRVRRVANRALAKPLTQSVPSYSSSQGGV